MLKKQLLLHKIITTSWDDGHVSDFRLAGLLDKYQLMGTFYIPQKNAEQDVMKPEQVMQLSEYFEIGGHTINHTRLNIDDTILIKDEISGSYNWLNDLLNKPPVAFAFPGGKYNQQSIKKVFESGYKVARTTELFSKKTSNNFRLMPTTLQVCKHSKFTYAKHLLKRKKIFNLVKWMKHGASTDLLKLTENFISNIHQSGGCFHLWGHSWEIEKYNLWNKLEDIFKAISNQQNFSYLTNGEIVALL